MRHPGLCPEYISRTLASVGSAARARRGRSDSFRAVKATAAPSSDISPPALLVQISASVVRDAKSSELRGPRLQTMVQPEYCSSSQADLVRSSSFCSSAAFSDVRAVNQPDPPGLRPAALWRRIREREFDLMSMSVRSKSSPIHSRRASTDRPWRASFKIGTFPLEKLPLTFRHRPDTDRFSRDSSTCDLVARRPRTWLTLSAVAPLRSQPLYSERNNTYTAANTTLMMTTSQQKIRRKPAPDPDTASTLPTMNPPARPPPTQPPVEATQNIERRAPHQFGLAPGMMQAGRAQSSAQTYPPPNPQPVPTRLTEPSPHPYREGADQTLRKDSSQPVQQVPDNGPWRLQPPVYREQSSYDPRLVINQGQQRLVPGNTETGQLGGFDPRLLSRREGQQRQVSQSAEPGQLANPDPRLVSYQEGEIYQAAELVEAGRHVNQKPRLVPDQGGHQRRVSADVESGRLANYGPGLASHQEERPRRVNESAEAVQRPDYRSRHVAYQIGQQSRAAEETRASHVARRNVSAPLNPQSAPQGTSNFIPSPAASDTNRPQRNGLPPPTTGASLNPYIAEEINHPPIPHAYRSTSQPPPPRNVRQPSPQSKKVHKPSLPDINAPRLPQSPDASPRNSPALRGRGRSESLVAPPSFGDISPLHDASSRPNSYHSDAGSSDGKGTKRRNWLPGRSRRTSQDMTALVNGPGAWVIGEGAKVDYNLEPLLCGKKVPELWDDNTDTFVYLFPEGSNRGPSFRVPSVIISSSPKLRVLAFGHSQGSLRKRARSFDGRSTLSVTDATRYINLRSPATPPYTPTIAAQDNQTSSDGSAESISSLREIIRRESHLYFPSGLKNSSLNPQQISQEEHDRLVSVRNLFAFLMGRPLVATKNAPSVFSVLCVIANHLKELEFSNADGSTYGEVATISLSHYIETMGLTAVGTSREMTLEGIVLGERLRSMELYNEAFTHAVGKYEAIHDMKSPVWDMITPNTRNRLERAFMDLTQRQQSVQLRLSDFEFPSLFAGFAASTSSAASKVVRFRAWKSSFLALRRHTLSYYKTLHGDWPPKAKSKKNNFSVSGLNRLVLKALFNDFCTVYDLLVDRESITNRSMDAQEVLPEGDTESELTVSALRKVESEYDHSSPPVQPPMPFDIPKLPTMVTLDPRVNEYAPKVRQQAETRKLHRHESILILTKSHNLDSDAHSPFLKAFRAFEEKEAKSKSTQDLADQRCGYWLFIYVVLQALPMIVIDAPGIQHADGVEYFLCQPTKGGPPWAEDRKAWYGVTGSSGVVALPSDVVDHGVEGTYRRSHCWVAAEKWLEAGHCPPETEYDQDHVDFDSSNQDGDIQRSYVQTDAPRDMSGTYRDGPLDRQGRTLSIVAESTSGSPAYERGTLSPPTQYSSTRPRARSASNYRRSIAFGLEQLPVPPGYNMSPHVSPHLSPNLSPRASPPIDTEQGLPGYGLGIVASNDTLSPETQRAGSVDIAPNVKSLDQILDSLEQEKAKKDKSRRKSFINLLDL